MKKYLTQVWMPSWSTWFSPTGAVGVEEGKWCDLCIQTWCFLVASGLKGYAS